MKATAGNHKIWSWGANNTGQLGLGFMSEQVSRPTRVELPDSSSERQCECETTTLDGLESASSKTTRILTIEGGGSHTLILVHNIDSLENQDPYQIITYGLVATKHAFPSKSVAFTSDEKNTSRIKPQVACGWDMGLYLNPDGILYSFGDNFFGQLGRTLKAPQKVSMKFAPVSLPPSSMDIVQLSAGLRHCAVIAKNSVSSGTDILLVWGDNSKGQLGLGEDIKIKTEPTQLVLYNAEGAVISPVKVRCGKYFTIVLGDDGRLYGCGLDKFGVFGNDSSCNSNGNGIVSAFSALQLSSDNLTLSYETKLEHIKDFQCGWNHVLVLLQNGKLLSWGRNNFRQLGRASLLESKGYDCTPNIVFEGLPDYHIDPVISISCGSEHNLVLTKCGKMFSWGWNEHENCGLPLKDGEQDHFIERPTKVDIFSNELDDLAAECKEQVVTLIGCGAGNSFAVTLS